MPLMSLSSGSAECILQGLRKGGGLPFLTALAPHFKLIVHGSTCDKAASNFRFWKARAQMDAAAVIFATFCRIHCLNTALGRSMNVATVATDVSGVVHLGLVMGPVGVTAKLRKLLKEAILKHLDAADLDISQSELGDAEFCRWSMELLLPGPALADIRRRKILSHYLVSCHPDKQFRLRRVVDKTNAAREIAEAVLPGPIPVLQRARWVKNCRPIREAALFFMFGRPCS